jgi:hypothetical protein
MVLAIANSQRSRSRRGRSPGTSSPRPPSAERTAATALALTLPRLGRAGAHSRDCVHEHRAGQAGPAHRAVAHDERAWGVLIDLCPQPDEPHPDGNPAIMLAAVGEGMTAVAGRVADGMRLT